LRSFAIVSLPDAETVLDESPLQAPPERISADERSDPWTVGEERPQERQDPSECPVARAVERKMRREVSIGDESQSRCRRHRVDFVGAKERARVPAPGEVADGRLVQSAIREEVVDEHQASAGPKGATYVAEKGSGVARMEERLDPVREVQIRGQRIPAEVPRQPKHPFLVPDALELLAAHGNAEALGGAPIEQIEEARADAAAQIEDSRPGAAKAFDLPQDELVDEMKRPGGIANPFAPDRPVENAFAAPLTAREKDAGIRVIVPRDLSRILRHHRSLPSPANV
jgi:hypothetical protein